MPIISLESIQLTLDQKRKLVASLTKTAADIIKIPEQAITVLIKENSGENIGIGGELLSDKQ